MQKDTSILVFIEKLRSVLDLDIIQIVDHWESDLCAIGLKRGNRLVYISTYGFCNDSVVRYDFDLEFVDEHEIDKIEIWKEGKGVSELEIIEELRSFLDV